MILLDILGYILGFIGAILLLISGIGLLRMPDTLTRMQAATKASTLGSLLIILSIACFEPSWIFKLIFLAIFIMITNPISSSILAKVTYKRFKDFIYLSSDIDAFKEKK